MSDLCLVELSNPEDGVPTTWPNIQLVNEPTSDYAYLLSGIIKGVVSNGTFPGSLADIKRAKALSNFGVYGMPPELELMEEGDFCVYQIRSQEEGGFGLDINLDLILELFSNFSIDLQKRACLSYIDFIFWNAAALGFTYDRSVVPHELLTEIDMEEFADAFALYMMFEKDCAEMLLHEDKEDRPFLAAVYLAQRGRSVNGN